MITYVTEVLYHFECTACSFKWTINHEHNVNKPMNCPNCNNVGNPRHVNWSPRLHGELTARAMMEG